MWILDDSWCRMKLSWSPFTHVRAWTFVDCDGCIHWYRIENGESRNSSLTLLSFINSWLIDTDCRFFILKSFYLRSSPCDYDDINRHCWFVKLRMAIDNCELMFVIPIRKLLEGKWHCILIISWGDDRMYGQRRVVIVIIIATHSLCKCS